MRFLKLLFKMALAGAALGMLIILAVAAMLVLEISIGLDPLRGRLEQILTAALQREVDIDGSIRLRSGLQPELRIDGLRIGNPGGWDTTDFARIGSSSMQIDLSALLDGGIEIMELDVEDVEVLAETRPDGMANWLFPKPDFAGDGDLEFTELQDLVLENVTLHYRATTGYVHEVMLDTVIGAMKEGEPMRLALTGEFRQQVFSASFTGGEFNDLLAVREPWPLDASVRIAGATLQAGGVLGQPLWGRDIDVLFELRGESFEEMADFLGLVRPSIGAYALSGRLSDTGFEFRASDLRASFGASELSGELRLQFAGEQPQLDGSLHVDRFDVEPWRVLVATIREDGQPDGDGSLALAQWYRRLDVGLDLSFERILNAPVVIGEGAMELRLVDGKVSAPLQVNLFGMPLAGGLELSVDDEFSLQIELAGERLDLAGVDQALGPAYQLAGEVGHMRVDLIGQATEFGELLTGLDLQVSAADTRLSYRTGEQAQPLIVALETVDYSRSVGHDLHFDAAGVVRGEAFTVRYASADVPTLAKDEPWGIDLQVAFPESQLHLKERSGDAEHSVIDLTLSGQDFNKIAPVLGLAPTEDLKYALTARLFWSEEELRASELQGQIGRSAVVGEISVLMRDEGTQMDAAVAFPRLDLVQLGVFPPAPAGEVAIVDAGAPAAATASGAPASLLPPGWELVEVDATLNIGQLVVPAVALTDISLRSRYRDGRVEPSPFSVTLGNTAITGEFAYDASTERPQARLGVAAERVDIGDLLRELDWTADVNMSAQRLAVDIEATGASVEEWLGSMTIRSEMSAGQWLFADPRFAERTTIKIDQGKGRMMSGGAITIALSGRIEDLPMQIDFQAAPTPGGRVAATLSATGAGAELELAATTALPLMLMEGDAQVKLSGDRLDSLDRLLGVELPPLGPYSVSGLLSMFDDGYDITDLDIRVGESDLQGSLSLDAATARPRVTVILTTNSFQIDDFDVGAPDRRQTGTSSQQAASGGASDAKQGDVIESLNALLSPEVMGSVDALLSLRAEQVLSGRDQIGRGSLTATLEDGRLSVSPLFVAWPDGSINLRLSLTPGHGMIDAQLNGRVERFDYLIAAHRINADSDMSGLISLDIDLKSRAADFENLLANATGRFNFAVWPEKFEAAVLDLWALNLVTALLPVLDDAPGSKVNCLVGRLQMSDGVMIPQDLLIDTERVRVRGEGEVDFKRQQVELLLVPRVKRAQVLQFDAPVEVKGDFSDFDANVTTGELMGTAFRMLVQFSYIGLAALFKSQELVLPANGSDVCTAPL